MTLTTSGETAVSAPLLYEASRRAIAQAAEDLWPGRGAVLGPECPGVTSYVCQVGHHFTDCLSDPDEERSTHCPLPKGCPVNGLRLGMDVADGQSGEARLWRRASRAWRGGRRHPEAAVAESLQGLHAGEDGLDAGADVCGTC